jgi:hypothetical protein
VCSVVSIVCTIVSVINVLQLCYTFSQNFKVVSESQKGD